MVSAYRKTRRYLVEKMKQLGTAQFENNLVTLVDWSNLLTGITSLPFMVAGGVFVLLSKTSPSTALDLKTERKYWYLSFTVILLLADMKFKRLKHEIDCERDKLKCYQSENASVISDISKHCEEALHRLQTVEEVLQDFKEELYLSCPEDDQNDGEYPDDNNFDDILGYEDQDEEYEE